MAGPLKIGLLVDSPEASRWVYEFAQWANQQTDIGVSHLFLHGRADSKIGPLGKFFRSTARNGIFHALSQVGFRLLEKFESLLLKQHPLHRDHLRSFDLSKIVKNHVQVTPLISKSGLSYRLNEADLQKVKSSGCDLLLRCGSGIFRGDILNATRFGVLSFHHADNRINRGGPPAFWEVYLRQPTTGFTIQRLTEELDGGDVFLRGHMGTKYFYLLNQAELYKKANAHLELILKKIATTGALPEALEKFPYSQPLYRRPGLAQIFIYVLRLKLRLLCKASSRFLGRRYRWGVAFARANWRDLVMWRANRIPNPPGHFLADPFVVKKNGKDFCFLEDFDFATGKGGISVYELGEKTGTRLGLALDEPFHLSFPYLFEFNQELYLCPESSQNKDIRAYRCVEFPLKWQLAKILRKDISAADTMIFQKGNRWWMLTNVDLAGTNDFCTELFLYSAESPLSENWEPHPMNPLVVDAARARNGGILREGERIFRVAQGQGFDMYGRQSAIYEILEINNQIYREQKVSEITPDFYKGLIGTHHLHSQSGISVFDFVSRSGTR